MRVRYPRCREQTFSTSSGKCAMVTYTFLRMPADKTLSDVTPQPFYRGTLILALDLRRQFLVISQTMSGIKAAIEEVCGMPVSETSLYESTRRVHRKGLTHGCWSVVKLEKDEAIQQYNSIKHMYAERVVAARALSQWAFKHTTKHP